MMPDIDYAELASRFPWFIHVSFFIGACRFAVKFFSEPLQVRLTAALGRLVAEDEEGARMVESWLKRPGYRLTAFMLDWLTSIKLPTWRTFRDRPKTDL